MATAAAAALGLAWFVANGIITPSSDCRTECGSEEGSVFPVCGDCSKYVLCYVSNYVRECPEGQNFDSTKGLCRPLAEFTCSPEQAPTPAPATKDNFITQILRALGLDNLFNSIVGFFSKLTSSLFRSPPKPSVKAESGGSPILEAPESGKAGLAPTAPNIRILLPHPSRPVLPPRAVSAGQVSGEDLAGLGDGLGRGNPSPPKLQSEDRALGEGGKTRRKGGWGLWRVLAVSGSATSPCPGRRTAWGRCVTIATTTSIAFTARRWSDPAHQARNGTRS